MTLIKHSKYKNSGILFELLVRQITSDTLEGKDSPIKDILKKYFVKTELGREYKLYETLVKKTSISESKADIIINTLAESSKSLNRGILKRQKYNLIKEIKEHYDVDSFFNHKLSNYKTYAAFYTLIEAYNQPQNQVDPSQLINNKITILEHLTAAPIKHNSVKHSVMEEFKSCDADVRLLTYKISMDEFNSKYKSLSENQKHVLKEYINSVDNLPRLKEFYIDSIKGIKRSLSELNSSTKDETIKIKINEIISIINTPSKTTQIKDSNMVDLLQYYELVEELKKANNG